MAIDQAWRDLMADTVTVEPYSGTRNGAGEKTYGAAVTYTCKVSGRNRMVRDRSNDEVLSTVTVVLDGAYGIGHEDRITLPARFTPRQPPILSVKRVSDEAGAHHDTVYC